MPLCIQPRASGLVRLVGASPIAGRFRDLSFEETRLILEHRRLDRFGARQGAAAGVERGIDFTDVERHASQQQVA